MIDDDDEEMEEEPKKTDETQGPFWQKHKKNITRKNKINSLIRIGQNKYVCLDWDKCRYFTWDKKRNSVSIFSKGLTAVN